MKKCIFSFAVGFLLLGGFFVITPPLYAQAQSANMSISEFIELLIALDVIPSEKVNTVREIVKSYSITTQHTSVPTCTAWTNKDTVAVDETFVVYWKGSSSVRYAKGKFGDKTEASGSQTISSGIPGTYEYPVKVYDGKGNTGSCIARVAVKEKSNTSVTSIPTCSLISDKKSYDFGESITYSWVSKNATYAFWQQDNSGRDHLLLPADKLPANGSQKVSAVIKGNPPVTLVVGGAYGTSTCSTTVHITYADPKITVTHVAWPYIQISYENLVQTEIDLINQSNNNVVYNQGIVNTSGTAKIYLEQTLPKGYYFFRVLKKYKHLTNDVILIESAPFYISPTLSNVNTLSVETIGEGHIISQGNPRRISCGTLEKDCYDTYTTGTAVTLTVTKGPRPIWKGCESVSKNGYNCTLRVNQPNTSVVANFGNIAALKPPTCTLTKDKDLYFLGDRVALSWKSIGAQYVQFEEDTSGKDYIKLPKEALGEHGTHSITADFLGNGPVKLVAYNSMGSSVCSVMIPVEERTVNSSVNAYVNAYVLQSIENNSIILKDTKIEKELLSFVIDSSGYQDKDVLIGIDSITFSIGLPFVKAGYWKDMIQEVILVSKEGNHFSSMDVFKATDHNNELRLGGQLHDEITLAFNEPKFMNFFSMPAGTRRTFTVIAVFKPGAVVGPFGYATGDNSSRGYVQASIVHIDGPVIINGTNQGPLFSVQSMY